MNFEWDENKNQANIEKHGVSFEYARSEFEFSGSVFLEDPFTGETRTRAFGYCEGRLYALVFTLRASNIRIISFRKANKKEVKRYG